MENLIKYIQTQNRNKIQIGNKFLTCENLRNVKDTNRQFFHVSKLIHSGYQFVMFDSLSKHWNNSDRDCV